ncbi:MAG: FeoA family protein [Slackia sp.]|nr:FeoA family protein [Slackia sp.]
MQEKQAMTLRDVAIGSSARVLKLSGEGPVKRHIMDMGITKGIEVFVRKAAPLGDPIEVTVRGYELSLRKSEAENVLVEPLP